MKTWIMTAIVLTTAAGMIAAILSIVLKSNIYPGSWPIIIYSALILAVLGGVGYWINLQDKTRAVKLKERNLQGLPPTKVN